MDRIPSMAEVPGMTKTQYKQLYKISPDVESKFGKRAMGLVRGMSASLYASRTWFKSEWEANQHMNLVKMETYSRLRSMGEDHELQDISYMLDHETPGGVSLLKQLPE